MMRVSLKKRLSVGFGLLVILILLLWITGTYFIYNLSGRSSAMLKENYQTVESTKFLIQAIDNIENIHSYELFAKGLHSNDSIYRNNVDVFEKNLEAVKNNITEIGEAQLIEELEYSFKEYLRIYRSLSQKDYVDNASFVQLVGAYNKTRDNIVHLWDLNMSAISHKNSLIKNTSYRAFVMMSLIGLFCFLIAALFFLHYPRYISKPVIQLTQGIQEIANRNYEKRLSFKSHDELAKLAQAFNTMASKLHEYEHSNLSELLFEKKRIDTIINNMNDGIIGIDNAGGVLFSNTIACKILNTESSTLTGKSVDELVQKNEQFNLIFQHVSNPAMTSEKEFHPIKILSEEKPVYYTQEILDVMLTETGEELPVNVGRVIIMKNITHFLEQDKAKTNFIATISHELKTPISSLRLNLKLLDDRRIGKLNNEQKDIIQALKDEAHKMSSITSELLDLAQVETGNIPLDIQAVLPAEIILYVKKTASNQAKSKGINVSYDYSPELPKMYCDSEKTAWVLLNLINNAIQYSEINSKITVEINQFDRQIQFMVRDWGVGIEEKYQQQIFEKFFRVPGSGQKGTGLGLAISKEFIRKQNGDIWVESAPGKGSCFYFVLPVYRKELEKRTGRIQ